MSLELRDLSAAKINTLFDRIRQEAEKIAQASGTKISFAPIDVPAVPAMMDEGVRAIITESVKSLGLSYKSMPSGAGHDAHDMARIAPTGMLFVPSVDGISHSPKEFTSKQDMANGANVLLHTVLRIDQGAVEQER